MHQSATHSAGVLYLDEDLRILMVKQRHKVYWDLPGGILNALESPYNGARRELLEELGPLFSKMVLGRMLLIDHIVSINSAHIAAVANAEVFSWLASMIVDAALKKEYYAFVFYGGIVSDTKGFETAIQLGEDIEEMRWMDMHQIYLANNPHAPKLVSRIEKAVFAAGRHYTLYLEDGQCPNDLLAPVGM